MSVKKCMARGAIDDIGGREEDEASLGHGRRKLEHGRPPTAAQKQRENQIDHPSMFNTGSCKP